MISQILATSNLTGSIKINSKLLLNLHLFNNKSIPVQALTESTSFKLHFISVECYDVDTDLWSLISPLVERRSGAGAASLNNYVYAIGGYNGDTQLNSVERYNPSLDTWTVTSPLVHRRSALSATVYCNKLYVIGGYDGEGFLNTMEEYVAEEDRWKLVSTMNLGRSGAGIAVGWKPATWFSCDQTLLYLSHVHQLQNSSSSQGCNSATIFFATGVLSLYSHYCLPQVVHFPVGVHLRASFEIWSWDILKVWPSYLILWILNSSPRKGSYNSSSDTDSYLVIVQFPKISILPHGRFCMPPSPTGNSSLASYFTSKILSFFFKTHLPLGISDDLPWGGYGFFLELHILFEH